MGQDEAEEAWELGPEGQEAGLTSVRTLDERGCGFRLVDGAYISGHNLECQNGRKQVWVMTGLASLKHLRMSGSRDTLENWTCPGLEPFQL